MPWAPKKRKLPNNKVDNRRAKEDSPEGKANRKFFNSSAWKKLRAWYRSEHPVCEAHLRQGKTVPGIEVHHVKPRSEYPELALEPSNLEHLCKPCHSAATAMESNFGR